MITPQRLTHGPLFHWFGYYDKLQFDPGGRWVLGMAVDFEGRPPRPDDILHLGLIDLQDDNHWQEIGRTSAWGWQQGCMLQWRPGSNHEVIWNERQGDRYGCRIYDVRTGESRSLPQPIYALSPDGRTAIGTDFRRIDDMRPGYGYTGLPDPDAADLAPADSGIYRLDLQTGRSERILSIAQVAALPNPHFDLSQAKHYFNHLLFSPTGERFIFLHRWRVGDGPFITRMLTAAADGSDLRVVDGYGHTSHFIWRDERRILAWTRLPSHGDAFYLLEDVEDGGAQAEPVGLGVMKVNGHCTYLADRDWILNDTYPLPPDRRQELYLYHVPSGRRIELGQFAAPPAYTGPERCDLHPRANVAGTQIIIDSAHEGLGRQMYRLDISAIVEK